MGFADTVINAAKRCTNIVPHEDETTRVGVSLVATSALLSAGSFFASGFLTHSKLLRSAIAGAVLLVAGLVGTGLGFGILSQMPERGAAAENPLIANDAFANYSAANAHSHQDVPENHRPDAGIPKPAGTDTQHSEQKLLSEELKAKSAEVRASLSEGDRTKLDNAWKAASEKVAAFRASLGITTPVTHEPQLLPGPNGKNDEIAIHLMTPHESFVGLFADKLPAMSEAELTHLLARQLFVAEGSKNRVRARGEHGILQHGFGFLGSVKASGESYSQPNLEKMLMHERFDRAANELLASIATGIRVPKQSSLRGAALRLLLIYKRLPEARRDDFVRALTAGKLTGNMKPLLNFFASVTGLTTPDGTRVAKPGEKLKLLIDLLTLRPDLVKRNMAKAAA